MTEIATRQEGNALALPTVDRAGTDIVADLGRWLQAAHLAQQIAEVACRGPFVPKAFQGRPEHAATAILSGAELGLSPGTALRSFHVIEGTASLSAKTVRALILSAGHELELVEEADTHVTMRGRRRGERDWTTITFTLAEAEKAGLLGKDVWKKWPKRMMTARVTTILGDLKFGDVLAGMPCTEVLEDGSIVDATVHDEPAPARTTAAAILARAEQAPPAPAPAAAINYEALDAAEMGLNRTPAPAPAPTEPEVQRYVLPVSKGRLDLIKAAFERHGYGSRATAVRDQRMRVLSHLIGRDEDHPVTDPRELTNDEAALVIDNIGHDGGARTIAEILDPRPADVPPGHAEDPQTGAVVDVQHDEYPDPYATVDPTTEPGWAAGEGQ